MPNLETAAHACSDLPEGGHITPYDRQHLATYLTLLYAAGEGTCIEDMARDVLGLDPGNDPDRARATVENHLARAHWLAANGYKLLLESEESNIADRPSHGDASTAF